MRNIELLFYRELFVSFEDVQVSEWQRPLRHLGQIYLNTNFLLFDRCFKGTKYKSDDVNSNNNNNLFAESHYTNAVIFLLTPRFLQRSSLVLNLNFTLVIIY